MAANGREQNSSFNLHDIPALQSVAVRDGVVLRPLAADDAGEVLRVLEADSAIRHRVAVASKMHRAEDVFAEIENYSQDPTLIRYSLFEDGRYVGLVSLWNDDGLFGMPPDPHAYGFGYFLDPKARGRGLVTDAIKALMDTATTYLGAERFIAFCEDDNEESIAVLKKLGFLADSETHYDDASGWTARKYTRELQHRA
jgi:RimJ/RimL family protein N-acetyltransferase